MAALFVPPRAHRRATGSPITMTDDGSLIDFVSSVAGDELLKVEEDLGAGYVRLRVSEAERRQAEHDIRCFEDVVVEVLRNSRDADAHRVFVASSREGDSRSLVIIDDGAGIPADMHERVFEPRVTSKLETMTTDRWGVHGRGMALFSVRSNVDEVRVMSSSPQGGTALWIRSDTIGLPERADQSTWPVVEVVPGDQTPSFRGPHNIIRRVVEFAFEHPDVAVFLGTPTEILATLVSLAKAESPATALAFCEDASDLPVWQRAAAASDASDLVSQASAIGLQVSERTAHRILSGSLAPLERVTDEATVEEPETETPVDIYRDRRSVRIHSDDLDDFKRGLLDAFDTLSERYYLNVKGEPRVTVSKDEIRVRFQIDKDD